jgi:hypothetical protein
MQSESENKEKTADKKYFNELNKFMICDKIFGAYIHCINEFTNKDKDCEKISNVLDNIQLCNIQTKTK